MLAPGAISYSYDIKRPETTETTPVRQDKKIIESSPLANKRAVAPGMTSRAETRIMPTMRMDITMDTASDIRKRLFRNTT